MSDKAAISILDNGSSQHQCWSCGAMRAAHFCDSCGHLQPAEPTNFFSFFGLPRKLNIDAKQLETVFYALSRKLHPDVFARVYGPEQDWSLQKTSQLNDAYRTLRNPIFRTEYLLKLEGVQMEEQSKTATEQARTSGVVKKQAIPPELLEEVFELNMQLEEARMNKKMGESDAQLAADLQKTKSSLEDKYAALDSELRGYWNEWDAFIDRYDTGDSSPERAATDDAERKQIRDNMVSLLNRSSYIRNLVRDVNDVLEI